MPVTGRRPSPPGRERNDEKDHKDQGQPASTPFPWFAEPVFEHPATSAYDDVVLGSLTSASAFSSQYVMPMSRNIAVAVARWPCPFW